MGAFLCYLGVRVLELHRILKPTGGLYLPTDPTAHAHVKAMLNAVFGRGNFKNEVSWSYDYGGRSKSYWPKKHDVLLYYSKSLNYTFNYGTLERLPYKGLMHTYRGNQEAKKDGKTPTDVWDIPVINTMARERTGYPAQKPLPL